MMCKFVEKFIERYMLRDADVQFCFFLSFLLYVCCFLSSVKSNSFVLVFSFGFLSLFWFVMGFDVIEKKRSGVY